MVGLLDEGPTMVNLLFVLIVSLVDPSPIIFNFVSNSFLVVEIYHRLSFQDELFAQHTYKMMMGEYT